MAPTIPPFSDLPVDKNGPRGNAWGVWGPNDQIGTLNHLTPDVVARAAKEEIRTGRRISLNWSMTGLSNPKTGRKGLEVKLVNKEPLKVAHDDELSFNSQISSQWDGFRHYGYQQEKMYFMGHVAEDFQTSTVNGIHPDIAKQGIAGRGILIDWYKWATEQRHLPIDTFTPYTITFPSLMEAAQFQGLSQADFRPGDILFIRSGYVHQYETLTDEQREVLSERYQHQKPENIGVEPSEAFLSFLWDGRFAAVAGDSRSFEVWPCTVPQWHLHEWLLAGWGMPIGELLDLEELSAVCAELGRYTFFLSSEPLNVPGAVASPPNALAFF
ncbi:hypothetical protein ASPWEDRAFT_53329 [Aspergillus wentii DTO 134E9]|uniref:Cyclase n=1 Tax=Aspergillus wentii DTO 134E9 TaxID=1073089 RepID=A0A1L9RER3_ASPWE|nr:uncharacterized protein ASPWEDRAFT_53329 [Aspergillus wentii DTO 134E9]OJJ33353.1 hypothetical protein ASPWEDRAFT_53329 [Aspergillus wentii DTO 134E9]